MSPLDRILRQIESASVRPCVEEGERIRTYGEFGRMLRGLAGSIATGHPAPRVAIALPQGGLAYAAMAATWMAGGFYAPINMDHPPDRQGLVLGQFDPDVVLARPEAWAALRGAASRARFIDPESAIGGPAPERPREPHRLAYVIFTSGSTGIPKGVAISQAALGHYLDWALPALGIGPEDRISQHPNIGFDLSVIDIYAGLCAGACLVPIISRKDRLMPGLAIRDRRLTHWVSVPSVVDLIRRAGHDRPEFLQSLRTLFFCGEPLLPIHVDCLLGALPEARIINAYGPTEATVSCTARVLTRDDHRPACRTSVAFGEAIPGMRVELIGGGDSQEGEIALSGPQLAEGYWNDPERTAAAFRTGADGRRRYFTGDWARVIDGEWFFESRIDRQIKIRGYRLELDEVDAALIAAGALISHTVFRAVGHGELMSFIEPGPGFDESAARLLLAARLPNYAVPARIVTLEALPRNANDKIDHNALLAMVDNHA